MGHVSQILSVCVETPYYIKKPSCVIVYFSRISLHACSMRQDVQRLDDVLALFSEPTLSAWLTLSYRYYTLHSNREHDIKSPQTACFFFLILLQYLGVLQCVGGGFLTNWFKVFCFVLLLGCCFFSFSTHLTAVGLIFHYSELWSFSSALIYFRAASK